MQRERKEAYHRVREKARQLREKQAQMYTKLKPISPRKLPEDISLGKEVTQAQLLTHKRAAARRQTVASETWGSIEAFEASIRHSALPASDDSSRPFSTGSIPEGVTNKMATRRAVSHLSRTTIETCRQSPLTS